MMYNIVNFKMEKEYRMQVFAGQLECDIKEKDDIYRVFDNCFKSRYTLFREDLNPDEEIGED